jgi:photosynthetic reaction center cytochrome c subunit
LPAYQLMPTMHFFEASLGFDCSNCHVRGHNDSDKKPEKRKARKMIEMMQAINKNDFDGKQMVTCFTCHGGNATPKTIPAVMTESMMKAENNENENDKMISVPNRLDTPEQIIAKYQQAIGGKDAFDKITSLKLEGTVSSGEGREFQVTIYKKAPNFYLSSSQSHFGTFEEGYNGKTGWEKNPRGVREINQPDIQDLKLEADFYSPLDFLKNYSALKFSDVQVINNDTVYVVEGTSSSIRRYKFYFSTRTGILLREIQYDKTLLGDLQTEMDYRHYKNVNGILFPDEIHVANYERNEDIKYSNISANVPVEDSMFEMPPKTN